MTTQENPANSESKAVSGDDASSTNRQPKVITTSTASEYLNEENTPRDVRLLHLLLASQGVNQYEDVVPLQLMDFAYRYTRGVLKDAVIYHEYSRNNMAQPPAPISTTAGAGGSGTAAGMSSTQGTGVSTATSAAASTSAANAGQQSSAINVDDIRLAIAARTQYQFKPTAPPKELLLQLAQERNKKALPKVPNTWGVRLPPEKYCLTNTEIELDLNPNKKRKN
ncbi:hypothetical protein ACO0QE_003372 [Hanseniaspora vineae]